MSSHVPESRNDSSVFWHSDICLVRIYDNLEFEDTVQPAKLPDEEDSDHMDINVTGFGVFINKKDVDGYERSLHFKTTCMPIGSTSECKHRLCDDGYDNFH